MKHLFVPDELSLLAKNKGFNEKCLAIFDNEGFRLTREPLRNSELEGNHWRFTYPLYQQLIDWFRNVHSINIEIVFNDFGGGTTKEDRTWYYYMSSMSARHGKGEHGKEMLPYYEALNKAIEEALKLLP